MRGMGGEARSVRAAELAAELERAASSLSAVVSEVEPDHWRHTHGPGVWAIGKDAEHVIEAVGYHAWIVRRTIGDAASSRRPVLERSRLTSDLSPQDAVGLLARRSAEAAALIRGLTDEQLQLPTKPPRARGEVLAVTIERVMIGHYETHRAEIEAKRDALGT
jgi:hypothetical protein